MNVFKLLGTIAIENEGAMKAIDDTTKKVEKSEGKLTSAFKKIGAAVAAAFSVNVIKNFALACIETTAEMEAVNSQFSQVFGDMEASASENLESIANNAGVAVNRMKSSYTKIAAFAKTSGMETADALSLADRALVAVADSAAFYDRTLEETTESLQSFLKGNYENDAALGLSCTEVTRNTAAMKLYGKSFNDLSEAQKQLTLLKMVEDANALSGALGQASREADTWTNQVGNLKQRWQDFKATVGKNFLDEAVGAVKVLIDVVDKLIEGVEWLSNNKDKIRDWAAMLGSAAATVGTFLAIMHWEAIMSAATKALQGVTLGIRAMNSAITKNPIGLLISLIVGLVSYLTYLYETNEEFREAVQAAWEKITDVINTFVGWLQANIVPIIKSVWRTITNIVRVFVDWFEDNVLPIIKSVIQGIIKAINALKPVFEAVCGAITTAVKTVVNVVKPIVSAVFGWFENLFKSTGDKAGGILQTIQDVFVSAWEFISGIWEACVPFFEGIWEGIILPLAELFEEIFGAFQEAWNVICLLWEEVSPFFESIWAGIKAVFSVVVEVLGGFFSAAWDVIKAVWDVAVTYFAYVWAGIKAVFSVVAAVLGGFFSTAWEVIKATWNTVIDFFTMIWAGIKAVFSVVGAVLSGDFSDAWEAIKNAWSQVGDFFSGIWESIKGVFGAAINWFGNTFGAAWNAIKTVFSAVGDFFKGVWDGITDIFSAVGTAIADAISGAVKAAINAVLSGAIAIINGFISAINLAISIINAIPGVEIDKLDKLEVPELEEGGVLEKGQVGLLEGNGAEAVVPLEKNSKWISRVADDMQNQGIGGDSESKDLLKSILAVLLDIKDSLPDELVDAIASGLTWNVNDREFARLVKAVN